MKTPLLDPFGYGDMTIRTLDDFDAAGQRVGLRLDINSPIDETGLVDDFRLRAHLDTLNELADDGAKVAILAHQGRPGDDSFHCLRPHADRLDDLIDAPVSYIDSTFSSSACECISSLDNGEYVVLENTRFFSEEYMSFSATRAAQTYLVKKLANNLDAYVNDAFAASHRSQPSLVGFPPVIQSYAGRLVEQELNILGNIEKTDRPRAYFLAGAKVPDSLAVAETVLETDLADVVLTAGLFGNFLLHADNTDLGAPSQGILENFGVLGEIDRAKTLLETYPERIKTPVDFALEHDGERVELQKNELPADAPLFDVGETTIDEYSGILESVETVILNGPAGKVENPLFTRGTRGLYTAATATNYSIVGGGDTGAVLRQLGIDGFDHVSTGGGAAMRMLAGETLPAVAALENAD